MPRCRSVINSRSVGHSRRAGQDNLAWLAIHIESPAARDRGAATNIELARCWGLAHRNFRGEPAIEAAALWGISGDGICIMVRVDLPNTAGSRGWMRLFREGLAARYQAPGVEIDLSFRTSIEPPPGSLEPGVFDLPRWIAAHGPGPPLTNAQRRELRATAGMPAGRLEKGGEPI
jgi:hypothetical protein